jgi:uncharacterized protein YqeY
LLRERLSGALKHATEAGDQRAVSMLRLIMMALKERDHSARDSGALEGLSDAGIEAMLRDMVEQRRTDITRCEECARVDVAEQEAEEIHVIEQFLPCRLSEPQVASAVDAAIRDIGATRLKDTGRVIAALKERYNGQMDFACAKRLLCERLH